MPNVIDPAKDCFVITPNDSADLEQMTKAIIVGSEGSLKVTTAKGRVVTVYCPAGLYPLQVSRVWDTDTTADNLTAFI